MNHNLIRAVQQPETRGHSECGQAAASIAASVFRNQAHRHPESFSQWSHVIVSVESIADWFISVSLGWTEKRVDLVEMNISDRRANLPLASSSFFSRTPKPSQPITGTS